MACWPCRTASSVTAQELTTTALPNPAARACAAMTSPSTEFNRQPNDIMRGTVMERVGVRGQESGDARQA